KYKIQKKYNMKSLKFLSLTIISLVVFACSNNKIIEPEITKSELFNHIDFLASDSLKGRYPGTAESKIAAQYIANEFKNSGLKLIPNSGLQNFKINLDIKSGVNNHLTIENKAFTIKQDYIPLSFSANKSLNSEVIFAGYGFNINTKTINWNDYSDIDVKGKWVLILRGDPEMGNNESEYIPYGSDRGKVLTAEEQNAGGVLLVSGQQFDKQDKLEKLNSPEGRVNIPVIHITKEVANILLSKENNTIKNLEEKLNKTFKSYSFNTNTELNATSNLILQENTTQNVVASLTCNKNSKDFIVIGGHYDHLGFGGPNTGSRVTNVHAVHYGADDNASGVSAMLEIAEKLSSIKDSLNKNFIFIAFGAEEVGLLGSKYFTDNPIIKTSNIKAMLNIDMVGRLRTDSALQIGGIGTSKRAKEIIQSTNNTNRFNLALSSEGHGPSDHSSFYSKDIPVFFFSTGAHVDYHTPRDSIGGINFEGLNDVSEFIYSVAKKLSNLDSNLVFQESGPKGDSHKHRNFKVTLGIMPDFAGFEKRGLKADIVIKGKPAYKAGMENGDIITAINGKSIRDIYEYMERLSKLHTGQRITVQILRNDKKDVLLVQL
ncbi:MAG: M20/M25/M40 family metallo-hydrolase, partial [Bacteroidales bacterium]|nr:M20/M25/M40 family metallo-hydrolase [Bacteroidales bacterium]